MRLLVACPKCQRQYEASGRPIGGRFRCRCGAVLEIHQPKGHDAAAVRCSACGAPREEGDKHCAYCGADFTLHDQDLETVCPKCFARVSDHARFCDHCGQPLAAEPLAIDETPLVCPACQHGRRLVGRSIGGHEISECPACAGMWLGNATLQDLIEQARRDETAAAVCAQLSHSPHPAVPQTHPKSHGYLPCPECGALMLRQNFGHGSGAVVDYCKQHGVWFEADKLSRVLNWVRSGEATIELPPQSDFQQAALAETEVRKGLATALVDPLLGHPSEPSFWRWILNSLSDTFGNR